MDAAWENEIREYAAFGQRMEIVPAELNLAILWNFAQASFRRKAQMASSWDRSQFAVGRQL